MRHLFLATLLILSSFSPALAQVKARWIVDDKDALQSRVDIIEQAKEEILVEYFYVAEDDQSLGGIALVLEAARKGVKVKIILDAIFASLPRSLYAALFDMARDAQGGNNIQIKVYNPISLNLFKMDQRDHAKMIIVDNNILMTGGRNLGDSYFGINKKRNFHDLDILVQGSLARDARENFMAVWDSNIVQDPQMYEYAQEKLDPVSCAYQEDITSCQLRQQYAVNEVKRQQTAIRRVFQEIITIEPGEDLVSSETRKEWLANSPIIQDVKFLSHKPDVLVSPKTAYLSHDLLKMLQSAKKDVNIVTPYLVPTENVIEAFRTLKARGVPVRIITNSLRSTDNLMTQAAYRTMQKELVKMGIEIWEYNKIDTIHAKTALFDYNHILVGTFNLDPRSAFINREMGLSLLDSENTGLAKQLEEIIENFRKDSVLVAKDGVAYNTEWQKDNVKELTPNQLLVYKALLYIAPTIKHKL